MIDLIDARKQEIRKLIMLDKHIEDLKQYLREETYREVKAKNQFPYGAM